MPLTLSFPVHFSHFFISIFFFIEVSGYNQKAVRTTPDFFTCAACDKVLFMFHLQHLGECKAQTAADVSLVDMSCAHEEAGSEINVATDTHEEEMGQDKLALRVYLFKLLILYMYTYMCMSLGSRKCMLADVINTLAPLQVQNHKLYKLIF